MNYDDWPDCAIKGCPNKCCLRLRSRYCWPHTPGERPNEVMESLMEENIPGILFFSEVGDPNKW